MMSSKTKKIRSTLVFSASVIALVLTAGCKHIENPARVAGWALVDPSERHPIMVSQEPTTLKIHVPAGSSGLNPRQRAEVMHFANQYRISDAGNGKVVVAVPSGAANEVSAMHAVEDIRHLLDEEGFARSDVAVDAFYDDHNPQPPIRLSYTRYVAEGPECGAYPDNLASQSDNMSYQDLGCTTQRNLAAMVANPADLLGPRTSTPRSAERRDVTFGQWTKGEQTSADRSSDERINTRKGGE